MGQACRRGRPCVREYSTRPMCLQESPRVPRHQRYSRAATSLRRCASVARCAVFHGSRLENSSGTSERTRPICLARSVPLTSENGSVNWTWTMQNCSDHLRNDGQKLEILKQGVYIIYFHVTHKPMANVQNEDVFTVNVMKERKGAKSVLIKMTEYADRMKCASCQPYISMDHPYQLQKGDHLYLEFNNLSNIDKNITFWGVYEIAPITVFSSTLFQESA